MTDQERWEILRRAAIESAKKDLLDALLKATGLDKYIADAIEAHERQQHDQYD